MILSSFLFSMVRDCSALLSPCRLRCAQDFRGDFMLSERIENSQLINSSSKDMDKPSLAGPNTFSEKLAPVASVKKQIYSGAWETFASEISHIFVKEVTGGKHLPEPVQWAINSLTFDFVYFSWNKLWESSLTKRRTNSQYGYETFKRTKRKRMACLIPEDIDAPYPLVCNLRTSVINLTEIEQPIVYILEFNNSEYDCYMNTRNLSYSNGKRKRSHKRARAMAIIVMRYILIPILLQSLAHTITSVTVHVVAEEFPEFLADIDKVFK